MKNYYSILQVNQNASTQEIKKAYYRLALLNHPDTNTDQNAHEQFVLINEAFQVLSSPIKRRNYDYVSNPANSQKKGSRRYQRRNSNVNTASSKGRRKSNRYKNQPKSKFEKRAKQNPRYSFWDGVLDAVYFILELFS